jgi:AraC family transcriptional regulator
MKLNILNREDAKVLAVRHTGPYPEIDKAFQGLGGAVAELGLDPSGGEWLAIFHDDPEKTPAEELRSDACLTLPAGEPPAETIPEGARLDTLPGGRFAMARHEGSYAGLPAAWGEFIREAMPAAGLKCRPGLCFEVYRNDPDHTPADDLITELYEPVED